MNNFEASTSIIPDNLTTKKNNQTTVALSKDNYITIIKLCKTSHFREKYPHFLEDLNAYVKDIPENELVNVSVNLVQDDYDYPQIEITYTRPATEEEITEYRETQARALKRREEEDRALYERLKERFGK